MSRPQVRVVAAPASSAEDEIDVRIRQLEEHLVSLVSQENGEAVESHAAGDGRGLLPLSDSRVVTSGRRITEERELPRPQNLRNMVPLPTSKVQNSVSKELNDASRMHVSTSAETVSTSAETVSTSAETVSTSAETVTFVKKSRKNPDRSGGAVRSSQDQVVSSNSDAIKDDKLKKVYPTSTTELLLTPGSQALMMQPVQGQHKADFAEPIRLPESIRTINSAGHTPDIARISSDKIKDGSKFASTDSVLRANLQALLQKIESDALHQKDEIVLKQSRSRQRSVTKTLLTLDYSKNGDAVGLHKLVQEGDVNSIIKMHSSLSLLDWGRALFSRDTCDLTPLALACHLGSVETTSQLLSLGAARSIFVCGFMPGEFLCTLPFARVVPESHISREGREIAERKARLFDHQKLSKNDKLQTAIDSALEVHVKQLIEGNLDFPQLNASGNASVEVEEPKGTSEEMSKGDIVRLGSSLKRSSILVSRRGTDNTVASDACLGAHCRNQLGIVVHVSGETLAVASLSSGHVCEYAPSDLVFADGSSLESVIQTLTEIKCPSGHTMKRLEGGSNWKCDVCHKSKSSNPRMRCSTCDYDLCNKCENRCGSPKSRSKTQDSSSFYKFGDTVTFSSSAFRTQCSNVSSDKMLPDPQPKIGMTVKATSDKGGAPSGKPTLAFSKGTKIKIKKLIQENGEWYATGKMFENLWFPLSSTDWKTRAGSTADSAVGCCNLTEKNFSSGLKVVRGPGLFPVCSWCPLTPFCASPHTLNSCSY